jgi:hypothetical protein
MVFPFQILFTVIITTGSWGEREREKHLDSLWEWPEGKSPSDMKHHRRQCHHQRRRWQQRTQSDCLQPTLLEATTLRCQVRERERERKREREREREREGEREREQDVCRSVVALDLAALHRLRLLRCFHPVPLRRRRRPVFSCPLRPRWPLDGQTGAGAGHFVSGTMSGRSNDIALLL